MKKNGYLLRLIFFLIVIIFFSFITLGYFKFAGNRDIIKTEILRVITAGEQGCVFKKINENNFDYYSIEVNGAPAGYILANSNKINTLTQLPQKYFLITPDLELNSVFECIHSVKNIMLCDTGFIKEVSYKNEPEPEQFIKFIKLSSQPADSLEGVYTGSAKGVKGDIRVKVYVRDKRIYKIEILESSDDSYPAGKEALSVIPQRIIDNQNFEIDGVSGATITCKGIVEAVKNSLNSSQK